MHEHSYCCVRALYDREWAQCLGRKTMQSRQDWHENTRPIEIRMPFNGSAAHTKCAFFPSSRLLLCRILFMLTYQVVWRCVCVCVRARLLLLKSCFTYCFYACAQFFVFDSTLPFWEIVREAFEHFYNFWVPTRICSRTNDWKCRHFSLQNSSNNKSTHAHEYWAIITYYS